MGRLFAYGDHSKENITDTFSCMTNTNINSTNNNSSTFGKFIDSRTAQMPTRWKSKQFEAPGPKRCASAGTVRGTVSQDCLFEREFLPGFGGLDRSGKTFGSYNDKHKPGYLLGRDAYTNTIETERLRETLRKEQRVIAKNMEGERERTARRLARAQTPEEEAIRKRVSSRKYRPTSASAIGVNLHRAPLLNPQSYGKPMPGFPTAYDCKHAHRPVLVSDGAPGFYRKTAGPSPVMWGGTKGDGRLAQMDSRSF